jgi:hypothetical protein
MRLQIDGRTRDLAMFNLAIDSKLRGCDVVALRVEDVAPSGYAVERATVRQRSVLRFETLFQGIDGAGAANGNQLDQDFAAAGVKVVYLSEASSTSSDTLRRSPQQVSQLCGKARLWISQPQRCRRGLSEFSRSSRFREGLVRVKLSR